MKNILKTYFSFAFIISNFFLYAQEVHVSSAIMTYEDTERPCVTIVVESSVDEVRDAWEDYIKDKHDIKLKGNSLFSHKDVLQAKEVQFNAISDKSMNFYTKIVEKEEQTEMCVFASLGYDVHINPRDYPSEYTAMENITNQFLRGFIPSHYKQLIEDGSEKVENLTDDKCDLEKDIADNKGEISKLKEKIDALKKENKDHEAELVDVKIELEKSSNMLQKHEQQLKTINKRLTSNK